MAEQEGISFTAAMFAVAQRPEGRTGQEAQPPAQLPDDVRPFIGRDGELEQLDAARGSTRALVVAGPAGVGKTALATRFAHRMLEQYPDGQLFVNLRGYDAGAPLGAPSALERMLRALGLAPQQIPADLADRARLYRSMLAGRRVLVVLDNAATADQVRPLLPEGPGCLAVITSRARLPELAAGREAHLLELDLLSNAQAEAMFTATAAAYRPGDDPGEVAGLALLCAGLPLALRIAAERAAARPLTALPDLICDLRAESALWDALSTDDGEPDAVRAVFSWTYRALPPRAARALRLLALHPGPQFGVPAAAAVTGQSLRSARSALELLAGAHLLERVGEERYEFHDLVRTYALGQAHSEEDGPERRAAVERAALWYLRSADSAARTVQSVFAPDLGESGAPGAAGAAFQDRDDALRWYRAEQPNLLAAVRGASEAGLDEVAWQMPVALLGIHIAVGSLQDWLEMSEIAVDAARRLEDARAEALARESLGIAAKAAGFMQQAAEQHQAARDLFGSLGDHVGAAHCAHSLALVYLQQRDLPRARAGFEQSLAAARQHGDGARECAALCCLAYAAAGLGEPQAAEALAEQSLAVHATSGADRYLGVDPLLLLARIHREEGRLGAAAAALDRADAAAAGLSHRALALAALLERAELAHAEGDDEHALELYWEHAAVHRSGGDLLQRAAALDGAGRALRARGRLPEALEAFQRAAELSRGPGHCWQSAVALVHAAEVLADTDRPERAVETGAEALALLAGFGDPHAEELRTRLRALSQRDEP